MLNYCESLNRKQKNKKKKCQIFSSFSTKYGQIHGKGSVSPGILIKFSTFLNGSLDAQLPAEFEMSSIKPFPSIASKKKKFFKGSPLPDIPLMTSWEVQSNHVNI